LGWAGSSHSIRSWNVVDWIISRKYSQRDQEIAVAREDAKQRALANFEKNLSENTLETKKTYLEFLAASEEHDRYHKSPKSREFASSREALMDLAEKLYGIRACRTEILEGLRDQLRLLEKTQLEEALRIFNQKMIEDPETTRALYRELTDTSSSESIKVHPGLELSEKLFGQILLVDFRSVINIGLKSEEYKKVDKELSKAAALKFYRAKIAESPQSVGFAQQNLKLVLQNGVPTNQSADMYRLSKEIYGAYLSEKLLKELNEEVQKLGL
jgi:hypothetical protein